VRRRARTGDSGGWRDELGDAGVAAKQDRVAGEGAQLAEQVTNLWSTWPSLSRWARSLARAGSERGAGATRSVPPGGASSEKHRGAQALAQGSDEVEGERADKDVRTYAELGVVVDRAQVQVYGLQAAETASLNSWSL
jgi:hypothetical protein